MSLYNKNLADLYDPLFGNIKQDLEFYKYFIQQNNGLALEIGSGTGRLLLEYLKDNLEIESIEPSEYMINICMQKAKKLNINPIIYNQSLQNLNLQKRYKTIYMPLFVFQNIIEYQEIYKSLENLYNQLDTNGQLLISIYLPWNDPTGTWEQTWRLIKTVNNINLFESVIFDKFEQIETKNYKHEIYENSVLIKSYFCIVKYRSYSINELRLLLKEFGFNKIEIYGDYEHILADGTNDSYIFRAIK